MPLVKPAARLLSDNLSLLQALSPDHGVLDLACGSGRNGLVLARLGIKVLFADNNPDALAQVQAHLNTQHLKAGIWEVDFEQPGKTVLAGKCFDAVLVFNYLHRPLLPAIRQAIRPGGLIFYETFTVAQRQYGKPSNPDFLLQPGELADCFNAWEVLHNYEGELDTPQRAVAQLIARKPATR